MPADPMSERQGAIQLADDIVDLAFKAASEHRLCYPVVLSGVETALGRLIAKVACRDGSRLERLVDGLEDGVAFI